VSTVNIHCPTIGTVTLLDIQQHSSALEAATITKSRHATAGSRNFTMLQKSLLEVASQKRQGTESKTAYSSLIIDAFGHYLWKAVSPEASNAGTPKLELGVRMVCTTDGRPRPHPVI